MAPCKAKPTAKPATPAPANNVFNALLKSKIPKIKNNPNKIVSTAINLAITFFIDCCIFPLSKILMVNLFTYLEIIIAIAKTMMAIIILGMLRIIASIHDNSFSIILDHASTN